MKVDWTAPWLAPLRELGDVVLRRYSSGGSGGSNASGMPMATALNLPQAPRVFVEQALAPVGEPYESFIARTGQVPTRNNLHDLFNGLMWHTHPQLKAQLNRLQAAAIGSDGVNATRGPLRDALTLFDEFGAVLHAPAQLVDALRARDWKTLFIAQRALWQQARLHIIGHALLEQLSVAPRKGLTAHVVVGDATVLRDHDWRRKPFLPLPVLGVPGWCAANEETHFYDDAQVFRHALESAAPRPNIRSCLQPTPRKRPNPP